MREWLDEAIFYEIYPQSFRDTNADGIGDINGIIEKLDYIQGMGFNAVWMNPCFDSPFVDAGYDVRDYYRVAERYGTNEDMRRLIDALHRRGMHLLLDLVPGHTSDQCHWFTESAKAEKNAFTDRYIWTERVWEPVEIGGGIRGWHRGGTQRDGAYAINYFDAQPALNYGFANPDPQKPWQQPMDAPGPLATREALKDVMRFWLKMGCDGFRVDMAMSLVKDDPDQAGTIALWQDVRAFLEREFPEAVMVSEWGEPNKSLIAGYHMDFVLHFGPSHYLELFRTARPYFSKKGDGNCKAFFDLYLSNMAKTRDRGGMICIPSGNHDMDRMARYLDDEEMKIAFAFLLSMPGVPFVYYGDEIGMRYVEGLTSIEGGYNRTGSRSPMAFDTTPNAGFSSAPAEMLYLAQDASIDVVNVAVEERDPRSLLHEVKKLIALRKAHAALGNRGDIEMAHLEESAYPLAYTRTAGDEHVLVILNPSGQAVSLDFPLPDQGEIIYRAGGAEDGISLEALRGGQPFPAAAAMMIEWKE